MAKPRSAKKGGQRPPARKGGPVGLPEELEDDVERFHKQRDVLSLDVNDDALSEDSLDELDDEEVLRLGGSDDEEDSDEFDSDEEMEKGTMYGKREWWSPLAAGKRCEA